MTYAPHQIETMRVRLEKLWSQRNWNPDTVHRAPVRKIVALWTKEVDKAARRALGRPVQPTLPGMAA